MADVKISALPAATTPVAGTEVLPIVQSGTTKKLTIADVTAGRAMSASSLTLTSPLAVASGGTGVTTSTGSGSVVLGTSPAITFPAGTVGAPGITTTGDTNTGIYFPAADTIGFVEGGVEAMRLDASGNLGLGVVPTTGGYGKSLQFTDSSADTLMTFQSQAINIDDRRFSITNNARSTGSGTWAYYNASSSATMYQQGSGQHRWFTAAPGSGTISFTQAMTLDASGNLLVGRTTTPNADTRFAAQGNSANGVTIRLDNVSQTSQYLSLGSMGSTAYGVNGWDNSSVVEAVADGVGSGTRALVLSAYNGPILFQVNSRANAARIDSSGNLLVGDTTYRLTGIAASGQAIQLGARTFIGTTSTGDTALGGLSGSEVTIFYASGSERARIDNSGNIICGTAAIATNATNGFLYVPGCAGTPTGTPTTYTGRVPIVVDTTNNKLYFYSGGQWRDAGP